MSKPNTAQMPLTEPAIVADQFVAVLARIETLGSVSRLIFAVPQSVLHGDAVAAEMIVVARLIVPTEALPQIAQMLVGTTPAAVGIAAKAEDRPERLN